MKKCFGLLFSVMIIFFSLAPFVFGGCVASSKALKETDLLLLANTKHDQAQDVIIGALLKKNFGEASQKLIDALKKDSEQLVKKAEQQTTRNVSVFSVQAMSWKKLGEIVLGGVDVAIDIASDYMTNPWIKWGISAFTALMGYAGVKKVKSVRKKGKIKKEVLKRQDPLDAEKYDNLVKHVEKLVTIGEIKV